MEPEKAFQLRSAVVWAAVIAAAHFALGTKTHSFHGLHILLAGLFMVPVLKAAVAFEVRGGLIAAAAVSGLYLGHVLWSWRNSPMANPDQYAMIGVYFVVGVSAGHLVKTANFRKWERDQVICRSARSETIRGLTALATALGERDPDSLRHSELVARICEVVGKLMGVGGEQLEQLRLAGLVHDVGKIGVADDVLFSTGSLDEQQRAVMHVHPARAAAMIRSIYGGEEMARIVEAHHESPDGLGYPKGLQGEQIPLLARILRVADVFAALSEQRRYKPSMTRGTVMETMRAMSGRSIDRECFDALERAVDQRLIPEVFTGPSSVSLGTAVHA